MLHAAIATANGWLHLERRALADQRATALRIPHNKETLALCAEVSLLSRAVAICHSVGMLG